jgi:hypothetical protein
MGEIFRSDVAAGTPLGIRAQHIMASGGSIDDGNTDAIVADRLTEDDTRDGFLLDGRRSLLVVLVAGCAPGRRGSRGWSRPGPRARS